MNYKKSFLLFLLVSIPTSYTVNADMSWSIQQITDNDFSDKEPVLSDTHIAWLARPGSRDDVYAYDGTDITQLSSSSEFSEQNLFASEKYIAWNIRDHINGDNVFLFDGTNASKVSNSGGEYGEYRPRVFGERMVWESTNYNSSASYGDIVLYDIASGVASGLTPPLISGHTTNDQNPSIYGDFIAFKALWGVSKLYIYDIINDTYDAVASSIANGPVLNDKYAVYDYSYSVKVYDRATDSNRSVGSGTGPQLDGDFVVWTEDSGITNYTDSIYVYDASNVGGTGQLIANNVEYAGAGISIHGNLIAYSGWDGNDLEIYIYDIRCATTTKLTDNDYSDVDPMVRGQKIVWSYYDGPDEGNGDYEIMLATATPGPDSCPGNFFIIPAGNGSAVIFPR